jgi:hypothetical protein
MGKEWARWVMGILSALGFLVGIGVLITVLMDEFPLAEGVSTELAFIIFGFYSFYTGLTVWALLLSKSVSRYLDFLRYSRGE